MTGETWSSTATAETAKLTEPHETLAFSGKEQINRRESGNSRGLQNCYTLFDVIRSLTVLSQRRSILKRRDGFVLGGRIAGKLAGFDQIDLRKCPIVGYVLVKYWDAMLALRVVRISSDLSHMREFHLRFLLRY